LICSIQNKLNKITYEAVFIIIHNHSSFLWSTNGTGTSR
jgi:hypothetical protein